MDWEKVLSRLSVTGLTLLVVGAVMGYQATRLCRLIWKEKGDRAILLVRVCGLAIALVGALILLDVIPGL